MEHLIVDLASHKLSKKVLQCLEELEKPYCKNKIDALSVRIEELYKQGKLVKYGYLIIRGRIALNRFCYEIEERIGKGVVCGFTFYSKEHHKLYYGAGANFPSYLKNYLHEQPPTACMETNEHYDRDEVFVVNTLDTWHNDKRNFASIFREHTDVRSGFSKRLRLHGVTFGTFECYYPYEYGPTEEDIALIRKEVQPLKENLYEMRQEILESFQKVQLDHS